MAQFLSEYVDANKMARVIFEGGVYGCTFFVDGAEVKQEMYPGKSEAWAEDAAENYVLGVKQLPI